VPVAEAENRILRENLSAPFDLPAFDTSTVDGYAARFVDIGPASVESPVFLPVTGRVAAGQEAAIPIETPACHRLYTGSMIPPGADSVVMQEDTVPHPPPPITIHHPPITQFAAEPRIGITSPTRPGENIRRRGEDVRIGAKVASTGDRLGFGRLTLLSALGVALIRVARRPVVAVQATGSELCEPANHHSPTTNHPASAPAPGRIYESNRAGLSCLIRRSGGLPRQLPLAPDNLESLSTALEAAFAEADVVVTAGGVSVGDLDLVRPAFARIGGEILFWRVDIRPGKPFVFGRWRGKLLFGLPGNPVSAAVCFWLLARPALLALQGASDLSPGLATAILGEPLANRGDRPHFFRVRRGAEGRLYSAGAQAAHVLSSLAESSGLVEVSPKTTLPVGSEVPFHAWD
jgi:molybdopterin molybdotransferase